MQTAVESQKPTPPAIGGNVWMDKPQRSFINVGHSVDARRNFEYPKLDEIAIDVTDVTDGTGEFIGSIKIEWVGTSEQYRVSVWNFSMGAVQYCNDVLVALAAPEMFRATLPVVCELLKTLGIQDNTPYEVIGGAA